MNELLLIGHETYKKLDGHRMSKAYFAQTPGITRVRLGTKRSTIMSKVEELRMAFEADDYSTLARIVGSLVWERDAEARYQLAEWIEELMLMEENGAKKLRRRGYATLAA
jgi:hypothetical protein